MALNIAPFTIEVDDNQIRDLRARLDTTRWPDPSPASAWQDGTDRTYLQRLAGYWAADFDWTAQQSALNAIPQFTTTLDGLRTHFIHQRGRGPAPFPLLMGHGFPGTPFDLRRIIPLLTDPGSHGGDPADAFDVVAPSLPGYGFSAAPDRPGVGPAKVAELWAQLMAGLGYERFGMQSGDWGAAVAMWLGLQAPERVTGLHLNFIPGFYQPPLGPGQPSLTGEEQTFLDDMATWFDVEGGYHRLQSTKPQTPAFALTDSPVGLAAWIVEKMRGWSDCGGSIERAFSKDDILTNVSIFWFTASFGPVMWFYRENRQRPNRFEAGQRIEPPLGVALFRTEPVPPRSWLQRVFDVTRYTVMPHGGHFGAWEEPARLAEEVRAFFRPLRTR